MTQTRLQQNLKALHIGRDVFDPLRLAIPATRRTGNHNVHLLVLVNPKTSLQTFVKSVSVSKTTPSGSVV